MKRRTGSRLFALLIVTILVAGTLFVGNAGGWRARIAARLLRVENYPALAPAPPGFRPLAPPGFQVTEFAANLQNPRWLATAPDEDILVAGSSSGEVLILKDGSNSPLSSSMEVFAQGLTQPFGIALRDNDIYIADTNEVVRFPFDPLTSKPQGPAEHLLDLPGGGYNQHWTRSLAFDKDAKRLFVSVGSQTNISVEKDPRRAAILVTGSEGKDYRVFASGLRNAAGIAVNPDSGELWATVNERDDLSDDVPDDYFTHVVDGGFYGWPYSYLGQHVDNRVPSRPDMVAKAIVPDVLLGAHVAPLQFVFYEGRQFPARYRGGAFIAEHGSWNRRVRSGYNVTFVPFRDGKPSGPPERFLSGFIPIDDPKGVYGRPVGVAVDHDGALLVSDDGGKVIWKVSYNPN